MNIAEPIIKTMRHMAICPRPCKAPFVRTFCFYHDFYVFVVVNRIVGIPNMITYFFVVRLVLNPRLTHCSRLSMCATFSRLFFIMFKCLVSISIFSLSRMCFSIDSSSYSFFIIDSLTLRAFRFSLTYFFSMSSTLSFLSSCFSISSWFWLRM